MKATTWKVGRNVSLMTMALFLALGAGTALADGEPVDSGELLPEHSPSQCPEDPVSEWPNEYPSSGDSGSAEVIVVAVRMLLTLVIP